MPSAAYAGAQQRRALTNEYRTANTLLMTGDVTIEPLRLRESAPLPFVVGSSNLPLRLEIGPGEQHSWEPEGEPYAGRLLVQLCINVLQGAVDVRVMSKDGQTCLQRVSLRGGAGWRQVQLITPQHLDLGPLVVRNPDANGASKLELVFVNAAPAYDCFLVYQPGKVGSQTLEAALKRVLPPSLVERHHYLSSKARSAAMNAARVGALDDATRKYFDGVHGVSQQVDGADRALARLSNLDPGKVLIITGIRDPISYSIAAFFQNIDVYCPWLTYETDKVVSETAAVMDYYMQQLSLAAKNIAPVSAAEAVTRQKLTHPGTWFEGEFNWYTGIDSYAVPLGEQPFCTFTAGKFDVLFFRYEHLGATINEMLRSVGLCPVRVPAENVGRKKISGSIYAEFSRTFVVTDDVRKVLLDNAYTRHFYPELATGGASAAG